MQTTIIAGLNRKLEAAVASRNASSAEAVRLRKKIAQLTRAFSAHTPTTLTASPGE